MNFVARILQFLIIMLCAFALSGCMLLGPNFTSPKAPQVQRYNYVPVPAKTVGSKLAGKGGAVQWFEKGRDIPGDWWRLFHSREINALVRLGLDNSPNLKAAEAALWQAQEILNQQIGNTMFPAVNGQFTGQRQRFSAATLGANTSSIFNLFNASVNVSYTLDLFGAYRRQIEALRAQVDYQQFQLLAAYLTLTANIVTTAVNAASLEQQIEVTQALIKFEDSQLVILRKQYDLGGIGLPSVLTQETLVNQTKATLPALQNSLSQAKNALAVLLGIFPDQPLPHIDLDHITLPSHIPVSFPSNLVRQRPDVRASEELLHAASAQIGVATANLLPQLTLTGNYGYTSPVPSQMFQAANSVWSIAGGVTQPIFHGGALLSARRQAIDAYTQAEAQYRQTVLQAFQNVGDSLRAIETDARALRDLKRAETAAYKALDLAQAQYKLGATSYLTLLITQEQYQRAVISRIRSQATRYTDTVALFQSLGGGWWHLPCTPPLIDKKTCA